MPRLPSKPRQKKEMVTWSVYRRDRTASFHDPTSCADSNRVKVGDYRTRDAAIACIMAQPPDSQGVLEVVRNESRVMASYVWKPASKVWAPRGFRHDQAMDTVLNSLKRG